MLSYEQIKAIEQTFGPQAPPVIDVLQTIDKRFDEQKLEVRRDLLIELATKADIARLEGEIKELSVLMKVLIGLSIIGMAFFSPNAAELLKLLK